MCASVYVNMCERVSVRVSVREGVCDYVSEDVCM